MTEVTGVPIVTTQSVAEDPPQIRPGMKTSEFAVTLLIIVLGSVLASGLIVNNTALQLAGVAMATLKAISYTWSRTLVKTAAMFVLLVGLAHTTTGCAWFKGETKAVAGDTVDCTTGPAQSEIKQYGPLFDSLLVYATDGGGKVNADAVKSAGRDLVLEVGGCVLADSIARALSPKPTDPKAPRASPLEADPSSLRDAIGALYPGKHFKTASGLL